MSGDASSSEYQVATTAPEVIFHNALVLGAATAGQPPTAVAVTGGRISAVGGEATVAAAGSATEIIDLDGRTLMPGINDGHLHVGGFSQSRPPAALNVTPAVCPTVRSITAAIAERAATLQPGTWIRGMGWVGAALPDLDSTEPSAGLLDDVSPNNPVVLTDFSGHAIWVNTAAMSTNASGWKKRFTPTPRPVLGRMVRRPGRAPSERAWWPIFVLSMPG